MYELLMYQVTSEKKIDDVVASIPTICQEHKFSLLNEYVYHQILDEKGFPIRRKAYVYEICQARVAAMVLTEEPGLAPFMPCRVAVYEDNAKTIISMQNMELSFNTLDKQSELYKETMNMFASLKKLMNGLA